MDMVKLYYQKDKDNWWRNDGKFLGIVCPVKPLLIGDSIELLGKKYIIHDFHFYTNDVICELHDYPEPKPTPKDLITGYLIPRTPTKFTHGNYSRYFVLLNADIETELEECISRAKKLLSIASE